MAVSSAHAKHKQFSDSIFFFFGGGGGGKGRDFLFGSLLINKHISPVPSSRKSAHLICVLYFLCRSQGKEEFLK